MADAPSNDGSGARQGTSSTRYAQQEETHAAGQLADTTPDVRVDSQGEKQGLMEPATIGQAPKHHPEHEVEQPQPGMLDQAKVTARQTAEYAKQLPKTVMKAVGMGDKSSEPQEQQVEQKEEDPKIDQMSGHKVEEFLRDQTTTQSSA